MQINFLVNVHRLDAVKAAIEAIAFVKSRGVAVATDSEGASVLGIDAVHKDELGKSDLMVTFGGDGTLIKAAGMCAPHGTPILGVYYGRFGFVTQCQPSEIGASLSDFFDKNATTEERMMLELDLLRGGTAVLTLHCLNEVTLHRSMSAPMLSFAVEVDGAYLTSYPADGVIVCTPTGSTAYNMSAGGPILDPKMQAMVLTAIAPHTLSARPLVLHKDSVINLKVQTNGDSVLSVDGKHHVHVLSGDQIRIKRSPLVTQLLSVDSKDFLRKLGERLSWGHSVFNKGVTD